MASIKEKIKAALFSNAALAVMWGAAFLADAALVGIGLLRENVTGAVAAMLGAIAAALMIFSILLREKAESGDENSDEESGFTANESETESEAAPEASSATAESESETESGSTVGSAKSGEAIAAGEEA